jgi:parallel beta-helix repeat protein
MKMSRRTVLTGALNAGAASLLKAQPALGAMFSDNKAAEIHVSPAGDDGNPGTKSKPLATLGAARERVRKNAAGSVVVLHGGVYALKGGLELGTKDSGSANKPVTYRGAEGEQVTLTNSTRIAGKEFRPVTDPGTLARIPNELHGKILELDLTRTDLQHVHRYPEIFEDNGGIVELFFNDHRMPMARYPKTGFMQMKKVLVNGGGLEVSGDWRSYYDNGAPTQRPPRPGVFEYRDDRAARWVSAVPRGVWLKGYWRIPWQNEAVRVAAIDTKEGTITLAVPVPGGIGNKYHRPEGDGKENYWLFNLLEELSEPGEWCLDFQDKKIYFYPPSSMDGADVLIADNDDPVLHVNGASDVVLENLTVTCVRNNGIEVTGGTRNVVAGCTVRNVIKNGIVLREGEQNQARSNDVSYTGAAGIWLSGGDEKSMPRKPAGHRVVNNHIHHFGEIERVYAPGINAGYTGNGGGGHHVAVGMYIANNLIHDGPHAGVLHGSWDHVFEYNETFRICTVSNDMGHFYCYDLYRRSGNRVFRYNFMHHSPLADGIYFDCDNREDKVYGNVVDGGNNAYLFKTGNSLDDPLQIFCWNNIAAHSKTGYRFVMRKGSDVKNNVAVDCKVPYSFPMESGKGPKPDGEAALTGKNLTYTGTDPGFVDMAAFNFALKPDSDVFKQIAFEPIPLAKIGLFRDAYRKTLPSDESLRRFENPDETHSGASDILDRKG